MPPKIAKGTLTIIVKGCRQLSNCAAIDKYAVINASPNIKYKPIFVFLYSSDSPL